MIGIVLALALGVGGGVLRIVNTESALRGGELAGNAAFAVVLAAPGLLALLGLRHRPSLLVAAGVLELVFASLLLISVGVVFVVPAVLFLVAAGQLRDGRATWPRAIAAVLVSVVLGTVAFFALFATEDPACWERYGTGETVRVEPGPSVEGESGSITSPPGVTESGCTSDTISTVEALSAVAIVALLLGAAWTISGPPSPRDDPVSATG